MTGRITNCSNVVGVKEMLATGDSLKFHNSQKLVVFTHFFSALSGYGMTFSLDGILR